MKQYKHQCIKNGCSTTYTDEDVDAYYCESCTKEKNKIAEQVDARFAGASKEQPMSDLQIHDAAAIDIKGMKFVKTTL